MDAAAILAAASARDSYGVLGLSRDATLDQARASFRQAALRWHPDKQAGNQQAADVFAAVHQAWQSISKQASNEPAQRPRWAAFDETAVDVQVRGEVHAVHVRGRRPRGTGGSAQGDALVHVSLAA